MKRILSLTIFLYSFGFSQSSKKDIADPNDLKVKEIRLEARLMAPSEVKLPFRQIKIIDSRFDTSKMGFTGKAFGGKTNAFNAIQFKGGFATAVEKYYADYYENSFDSSGFTLLIVIKKFWFSEFDYESNKQPFMQGNRSFIPKIRCKWEYYLCKDEKYLPVKRIDTTWSLNEDLSKYINEEFEEKSRRFLKFSLKALIEILDYGPAIEAFAKQPAKKIGEIITYNESRFNLPVLKDGKLAKGVFINFGEFKNNRPGIIVFTEKETRHDLIRTENFIEDANAVPIADFWGYYNGVSLKFSKFGNNKLYRKQHAFYFFVKAVSYNYSSFDNSIQQYNNRAVIKTRSEVWIPFQVDMETGEVY